ncbi:ASCL4 protein, partial [Crocuta crocuta]
MEKRKPAGLLPLRSCDLRTEPPDLPGTPPRLPSGEPFRDAACWQRAPRDCAFGPAFLRRRNERERQRVRCVNEGYARLRDHLPRELAERRLSKVQTLRAAIGYIRHLQQLLER